MKSPKKIKIRKSWGVLKPYTRKIADKTKYNRKKKQ